jgi:hypothetical protein
MYRAAFQELIPGISLLWRLFTFNSSLSVSKTLAPSGVM